MLGARIFFILILTILAVIDFRRGIIPNKIVYPAALVTLALELLFSDYEVMMVIIAGVVLACFIATAGLIQRKMGMGDVKLAFLIGLMTGLPVGFVAISIGIVLGGITAIILIATKIKSRYDEMPYGPFLASGAILSIMFASTIETYIQGLSTRL